MPDIICAAKRYEGGSGSAIFTGCIPLKPGQLVELGVAQSSQVSMSLWNGATEIGAYFSALYPQHYSTDPASVKSLMVSFSLNLDTATQPVDGVPLTLKIGTPRTVSGPSGHPTINRAWMKFPKLFGCTDPVHMCASRIAFGPLVPMNDPRVLALPNWRAFLTNELETGNPSNPAAFPTFKLVLDMLAARGDLGLRSGIFTPGSNIVTGIEGGNWPLPSSPQIGDAVVGMTVAANDGSFGGIFNTAASPVGTTTIAEILGPDSVRLNHIVRTDWHDGVNIVPRRYIAGFGPSILAGNANYNNAAILYYRYLTAASGHLDKLRQAHLLLQDRYHDNWSFTVKGGPTRATNESGGGSITRGTGTVAQAFGRYNHPYTDEFGVVHTVNEPFPLDEFGQPLNVNTSGDREDRSGFHQAAYMSYVLSGWGQALGNIIGFGVGQLATSSFSPFPGYPWNDPSLKPAQVVGAAASGFHTPSQQGFSGARLSFRLRREGELFLYMCSLPFDLNANPQAGPRMHPSPRNLAMREKWMRYWQRYCWDSFEEWSLEFAASGANNSFLRGLWGFSSWYNDSGIGGATAGFQLQLAFNLMMTLYCNVLEDPRFPAKMGELAQFFAHQQNLAPPENPTWERETPKAPAAVARASNPDIFRTPFIVTDPAYLESGQGYPSASLGSTDPFHNRRFQWTCILLCLLTYGWRVTGDPKLLEMADGMCTIYAMTDNLGNGNAGQPDDHKVRGEMFHMAFFALAYRVGETWGLSSAPPPEAEPESGVCGAASAVVF
jgi:hypothetical protein